MKEGLIAIVGKLLPSSHRVLQPVRTSFEDISKLVLTGEEVWKATVRQAKAAKGQLGA